MPNWGVEVWGLVISLSAALLASIKKVVNLFSQVARLEKEMTEHLAEVTVVRPRFYRLEQDVKNLSSKLDGVIVSNADDREEILKAISELSTELKTMTKVVYRALGRRGSDLVEVDLADD